MSPAAPELLFGPHILVESRAKSRPFGLIISMALAPISLDVMGADGPTHAALDGLGTRQCPRLNHQPDRPTLLTAHPARHTLIKFGELILRLPCYRVLVSIRPEVGPRC